MPHKHKSPASQAPASVPAPAAAAVEHPPVLDEPRFDVTVRVPANLRMEELQRRALEDARMAPEKVALLMQKLAHVPYAKVGSAVNKERAERARRDLAATGLEVEITPVLALAPVVEGRPAVAYSCPACGNAVTLTADRQCPSCGVYVDKVSKEEILRRRLLAEEQKRVETLTTQDASQREKERLAKLEEEMRRRIRAELEQKYGLKTKENFVTGRGGAWRMLGVLALTAMAFAGGFGVNQLIHPQAEPEAKPKSAAGMMSMAQVDQMIGSLGDRMAKLGGGEVVTTSLGLDTMGQGPDALVSLAQSERAQGQMPLGGAMFKAMQQADPSIRPTAPASTADGKTPSEAEELLSPRDRVLLTGRLALTLAEMGQGGRAHEVVRLLKSESVALTDPAVQAEIRLAEAQVRAWTVVDGTQAEALRNELMAIADPGERAVALGRAGAILATHRRLPAELNLAYLIRGGEALKAIPIAALRQQAADDWLVSMGQMLQADLRALARSGQWQKAQALLPQLDAVAVQASPGVARAELMGLQFLARHAMGQVDVAEAALDGALAQLTQQTALTPRAEGLRRLIQRTGVHEHPKLRNAARQLASAVEPLRGAEKAEPLAKLALIEADAGRSSEFDALSTRAEITPGLTPRHASTLYAELLVGSELALARSHHRSGAYGASEASLRKLAAYLL